MSIVIRPLNEHEIMRFEAAEASELEHNETLDIKALLKEGKWILASNEYADLTVV